MAEEKKKYVNKRRISGEFCQVHLQLPIKFNKILDELSKRDNMTKAAWVTHILEQVVANDGQVGAVETKVPDEKLDKLDAKLDTVINLISKL